MTSTVSNDRNEERRRRLLLGPLPSGFLRTNDTVDAIEADRQAALALQHQLGATMPTTAQLTTRLSITIAQAKLAKNYGLTRMDPYVRLRVGHCIYETHTDPSGGKNPRWNKVVQCLVPPGVNSIYLEIFDECSFTMDELIAWTHINIPQAVLKGETHEDWYPLNGKQGDGLEGMINLIMSYSQVTAMQAMQPMLVVPSTGLGFATMPVYPAQYAQHYAQHQDIERLQLPQSLQLRQQPQPPSQHPSQQQLQQQPITEEQVQQIQEMFPSIEKEVIKSILEANGGNNDAAINSLLQMSE